jgi:SHS2 domain-containing protein
MLAVRKQGEMVAGEKKYGPRRPVHRFLDHTGELEVELEAPTAEGLFAEAAAAVGELLNDGERPGGERRSWTEICLEAPARDRLLVDFIEELVFLAEREGMVPASAEVSLQGTELKARVGLIDRPPVPLVKAATLHNLTYVEEPDRVLARVVLDV